MSLIVWLHIWHFSWYKFHIRIGGSLPVDFQAHVQLTSSWLPVPILSIHYHHTLLVQFHFRFASGHISHILKHHIPPPFLEMASSSLLSLFSVSYTCVRYIVMAQSVRSSNRIYSKNVSATLPLVTTASKKIPLGGRGVWEYHTSKWNNFLH